MGKKSRFVIYISPKGKYINVIFELKKNISKFFYPFDSAKHMAEFAKLNLSFSRKDYINYL